MTQQYHSHFDLSIPSSGAPGRPRWRQGESAPLGSTYKIAQPSPDVQDLAFKKSLIKQRYALQDVVRHILPKSSTSYCGRAPLSPKMRQKFKMVAAPSIDIVSFGAGHASYQGLSRCSNVWTCPVCASVITEGRKVDIVKALENAKALGFIVMMLTSTFPHYSGDSLKEQLEKFAVARRLFRNRKTFKRWARETGMVGSIRAFEVTHGANGWHSHTHELFFFSPLKAERVGSLDGDYNTDLLPMWQAACLSAGLPCPSEAHGLDFKLVKDNPEYITKWGPDAELTKAHLKQGRKGSYTPWGMLREFEESGDMFFADKFAEYAREFKGKRQNLYSKGLRKLLNMDAEKSDVELVEETPKECVTVAHLNYDDWKMICRRGLRGDLLEAAANHGLIGVSHFLQEEYNKDGPS